ncbi:ethanolamine permease, partial [Xanthomonas perforans]
SVFGAIVMYVMSMLSLFRLRRAEPGLERSFRAPGYPVVPAIALLLALVCLVAMVWFNPIVALIFLGLLLFGAACCVLSLRTQHTPVASAG